MKYDVYGIGHPLVDIQAQVTDDQIGRLGFDKGVMTLVDAVVQSRVLRQLDGIPVERCAGGSVANTVVGVAHLGGTAAYAGKVAQDELGKFYLEDLARRKVSFEAPATSGHTGTCLVLISADAHRTMLTHLGVSVSLNEDDVAEDIVRQSKYIFIEGYLFTSPGPRAAALRAIALARKHGVKVAFSLSDPNLVKHCHDEFSRLVRGSVDLLFCNVDEARSLTGLQDPGECARAIHQHVESVALTLSGDGSIILHDGAVERIEGVPCAQVDTTGAGDMYAAGVLFGVTRGLSWKQAGILASYAASRVVAHLGARLKEYIDPYALLNGSPPRR